MDLAALRQQILSSSKTANEKAEDLLLESKVNELSKDEWRELIAGIPADVKKEIGRLKSAGTQLHLHMTGSTGQQEVYRKAATGVQENNCQSVVLQTVVADLTATRTSVQRVCGLYNDACAMMPFFHAAWLEDSVVFLSSEAFVGTDLMGNFSLLLTFRR